MCLINIRTLQKKRRYLAIFFAPIGAQQILLTQLRRVARDAANDVIGRIKKTPRLVLAAISHKPTIDARISPAHAIFDLRTRHLLLQPRDCFKMINLLRQHLFDQLQRQGAQRFFDHPDMALQSLHKIAQIFHQLVFENQKCLRAHHLLCAHTVEIAHIILVVSIKPFKIALQILPPNMHVLRRRIAHLCKTIHMFSNALQQRWLQRGPLHLQIFQP